MVDELSDLRKLELPFNVDEVIPQCHECVRTQLKKYEKFVFDGKAVGEKFMVLCKGIKKSLVSPMEEATMTDEQLDMLKATRDKVEFAKQFIRLPGDIPWIARWYQENVLRCTSRRKVLRIGRRTGKTDSVCVEILYKLFTNKDKKIFVTGPQKIHVEEIFIRLRSFIAAHPMLRDSVVRDVKAPYYEIKIRNGSRVRGVPAGAKGKKEGLAGRGQDADDIYVEEMDYVDGTALRGGIFPILHTTPNTSLCGFSTPTGFKTPYYTLCEESPGYKEFHFTYKVLPHWKQVEAEKPQFTEEDWKHEYLAEWGTSEGGVYKPSYIDRALVKYEYDSIKRNASWKYTIGTDWNEKYGTEIIVLGFNPFTNTYQVVESQHIEKSEFTQLSGISKLLEMNKKWMPNYIYIDAGNGSTNYELLRKTAWTHTHKNGDRNTANLLRILKKYDAGAALEIKDPITHEKTKKPAKPFMVNCSVRLFEQNLIRISSYDNKLEKQLRSYIVDRISPNGNPVYATEDPKVMDHRLDALNLAIVAFQLEFSDLHATVVNTQVGAVLDPRTKRNQKASTAEERKERLSRPEERRLDGGVEQTDLEKHILANQARRVDNHLGMNTNRLGWDTDQEEERMKEYLQRRKSRRKIHSNRPTRSNI